jgi:hypothetical protein
MTDTSRFSTWFNEVSAKALASDIGKLADANGFHISYGGGGCMCWEKIVSDDRYLWICDEGNGLGDKFDELYLVGFYTKDGEIIADDNVMNFADAIKWCQNFTLVQ